MSVHCAVAALAAPVESGRPWPRPLCPSCQTGYIGFSEPVEEVNHNCVVERDSPAFDPRWVSGTFTIHGQCENPMCRQVVHGAGDYHVDYWDQADCDESYGPCYSSYYTVKYLHPPILIMPVPQSAPDQVRDGILRASRVIFADPGLSATALRATVERFLTAEGICATRENGKFRSTQERIDEWAGSGPDRQPVAGLFSAVKWIGNAGTHEGAVLTTGEVLEGAGMLEEAFHRLFRGSGIEARAHTINTAKGPAPTQ